MPDPCAPDPKCGRCLGRGVEAGVGKCSVCGGTGTPPEPPDSGPPRKLAAFYEART